MVYCLSRVHINFWGVPGFKNSVKLFPHQVTCRDFMDIRESGSNFGGILADDNGCHGILVSVSEFNINAILSSQPRKINLFPCSNYGSTSSISRGANSSGMSYIYLPVAWACLIELKLQDGMHNEMVVASHYTRLKNALTTGDLLNLLQSWKPVDLHGEPWTSYIWYDWWWFDWLEWLRDQEQVIIGDWLQQLLNFNYLLFINITVFLLCKYPKTRWHNDLAEFPTLHSHPAPLGKLPKAPPGKMPATGIHHQKHHR